jgi:hypothetical protein
MDPSSWPYAYNRLQTAAGQQSHELQHVAYSAGTPHLLLHHQLRQAQAAHEAQISSQYQNIQNMSLPPSLVQAAASNKNHLHQQALANLNMRESAMAVRGGGNLDVSITSRSSSGDFSSNASILTPPQTPGSTPWKSSNGSGGLVVIPEPLKAESRHTSSSASSSSLNNRHSSSSYSISSHETIPNGSSSSSR